MVRRKENADGQEEERGRGDARGRGYERGPERDDGRAGGSDGDRGARPRAEAQEGPQEEGGDPYGDGDARGHLHRLPRAHGGGGEVERDGRQLRDGAARRAG